MGLYKEKYTVYLKPKIYELAQRYLVKSETLSWYLEKRIIRDLKEYGLHVPDDL